jgi:hypothetical protein
MKATELRKNLFQNLDHALQGQVLLIEYKGRQLEISAPAGNSKLSLAVSRDAIVGDADSLIRSEWDESHWKESDRV